jgi:hypothetical protein
MVLSFHNPALMLSNKATDSGNNANPIRAGEEKNVAGLVR